MKRYNAKVKKIRPEERDVYRSHAAGYVELHGGDDGESVEVGGLAWYSVELDEAGAAAFGEASNLVELEEAAVDTVCGAIENGVDVDQRKLNRTRGVPKGPITPLLMVADTGGTNHAYVAARRLDRWTWFADDGLGRNSHGPWCLGAATAPESGKFVVEAKTLGDNGSGPNTYTIAALSRFARLCLEKKAPGVASLSLGSDTPSTAYLDALRLCLASGVAVVAAAGNGSRRDGISYPAVYCSSVGAHDRGYAAAGFSNRSADGELPDVYALGAEVNGIGGVKSGTSMATPGVALAVWYAMSRGMQAGVMRSALRSHAAAGGRVLDGGKLLALAPKPAAKTVEEPEEKTRYVVQAGVFRRREGAERRAAEIRDAGHEAVVKVEKG